MAVGFPTFDAARAVSPNETIPEGTLIGAYRVVRLLKCGGMAAVYLAEHRGLQKPVALKLLLPALCQHPTLVTRFLREGQIASRLHHPNIVDITDVGLWEDQPYLVMEYLEGEALSALLLREGPLPLPRALALWLPVCAAMSALHEKGVVHRDLKPDNLFLSETHGGQITPKILDFGISHFDCADNLTVSQEVFGTPRYMSPEQFSNLREAGPASDQFSLAVILYQCLCGTTPFPGTSMMQIMYNVTNGVRIPLAQRRIDLPAQLCAAVERALAVQPAQRFASVQQLVEALVQTAPAAPALARTRSPGAALVLLGAVLVLLGVLGAWGWQQQRPPLPRLQVKPGGAPVVKPVVLPLVVPARPIAQPSPLPQPTAAPAPPPKAQESAKPRGSSAQAAGKPSGPVEAAAVTRLPVRADAPAPPAPPAPPRRSQSPTVSPAGPKTETDVTGTIILGL